jgi:hypothetical protein
VHVTCDGSKWETHRFLPTNGPYKIQITYTMSNFNYAPRSSTTPKKWHDDGRCGNNCITFEQSIKYLHNASNKQYASLLASREARRAGGRRGDRRGGVLKVVKKTLSKSYIKDIYQQSRKIVDLDKYPFKPSKILIPHSLFKPCKYSYHKHRSTL